MALSPVHLDGFDDYDTAQLVRHWTTVAATPAIGDYGRNGTNGIRFTTSLGAPFPSISHSFAPAAACAVAFAFRYDTGLTGQEPIVFLKDTSTLHVALRLNASGTLSVDRNGTELANSGAFALTGGRYYAIVFAVSIADSGGKYDVWVDGVKVITGVGDTRNAGNATVNNLVLGPSIGCQNGRLWDFDDMALFTGPSYTDADFPGDCRVFTDLPTGDGNYTAWTASAGADYTCVDENPPTDDTDYISTATPDDIDTFTFPALTGVGTVLGVMDVITSRMDDAGPRSIAGVARLAGTDVVGSTQAVSSYYAVQRELFLEKPGGGAFSLTDVNNAELGVKLVA